MNSDNSEIGQAQTLRRYVSPVRLHAAAHLYGIESAAVENAKVLELGCGDGRDLLTFAMGYPSANVVGVDIWPEEIQEASTSAKKLDIKNASFHTLQFSEIKKDFGLFDYIIVNDTFTWATSAAREAILRIATENLAPKGIAYIEYNTYPGWNAGDILRDAIQLHAHSAQSIEEVLASASAMLTLISDGPAIRRFDSVSLKDAIQKLRKHPEHYINNDFLQSTHTAFYFVEFANTAQQCGLAYIGDAEPQEELSNTHGLNVQLNHSLIALGQPKIMRQQYLDFAVGRTSRASLFTHQARSEDIFTSPAFERLADLRWASPFKRTASDRQSASANFIDGRGRKIALEDPTSISVLDGLSRIWPATSSFESLVLNTQEALTKLDSDMDYSKLVLRSLTSLLNLNAVHYSFGKGPYDTSIDEELRLLPNIDNLASTDGDSAILNSVNLWHESIAFKLDALAMSLLPYFNGKNNLAQVSEKLKSSMELKPHKDLPKQEQTITENNNQASIKTATVVDFLRLQGALTGNRKAWERFYQAAIQPLAGHEALRYLDSLALFSAPTAETQLQLRPNMRDHRNKKQVRPGKQPIPEMLHKISVLKQHEQFQEIVPIARKLTVEFPDEAFGWSELGTALAHIGAFKEGIKALVTAITIQPTNSRLHADLGSALQLQGLINDAAASLNRALRLDANNATAWCFLGNLCRHNNRTEDSRKCLQHALDLDPGYFDAHNNIANVLTEQMRIPEAIAHYRRALQSRPTYFQAHSNLLFALSHAETQDPSILFDEHKQFGRAVMRAKGNNATSISHLNIKDTDRPLRIGFVSGDLRSHAVAHFIEPIFHGLNTPLFELYAYYTFPKEDSTSARLKKHIKKWTPVAGLSDTTLAEMIRQDNIDILFDLSGHTGFNRLPMFALKPAPIQISWIGYPGTTGIGAMDYYFVDKYCAPPGELDPLFTEKLIYLPSVVSFQPHEDSPEIKSLPALKTGQFTFGSFNRLSKISRNVFALWARVLLAVPESRLLLGNVTGKALAEDLIAQFATYGIDQSRLVFRERTSMREYLHLHHQVDLLLDTFPYTGGTTTSHGLWMGIPTLTLAGNTLPSRQGAALLSHVNLDSFIVYNQDCYVEKAVRLSKDLPELNNLRNGMRQRIQNSPLRSSEFVVKGVEMALLKMWRSWCDGNSPKSFQITL